MCGKGPGFLSPPRQRGEENPAGGPAPQPVPGICEKYSSIQTNGIKSELK